MFCQLWIVRICDQVVLKREEKKSRLAFPFSGAGGDGLTSVIDGLARIAL